MTYYAHSGTDKATARHDWELLATHLREVSVTAGVSATATGVLNLATAATAAGLFHDLGKYRMGFQDHIGGRPVPREDSYHKQAGAAHAAGNVPIAFAIAGHHGGLPDKTDLKSLATAGADHVREFGLPLAVAGCPGLAAPVPPMPPLADPFAADLWTRVLFACLVDADWTCTGEFERKRKKREAEPPPPSLDPAKRLENVLGFIAGKADRCPEGDVKRVRADVLGACLKAAAGSPGLYSLTVPTGGGKTLASLAFALQHAALKDKRRVIYVAPYLTILEQNVDVIRAALGLSADAPDVFAHYSLAEPTGGAGTDDTTRDAAARRAEAWDAPVVVTTNVQFFESLFSNHPGRCRKLHNVAGSVIVLDECQSLPPGLVAPTCGMLRQLATQLGCTVVLCTATQPAFDHAALKGDGLQATEIIPADLKLFDRLKRVTVEWPKKDDPKLSWADVATAMAEERQGLCVVNTKKAAKAVYEALVADEKSRPGLFHLSTAMCPQHRREKLAQIRGLLAAEAPCRVVSTQLIEAGVDVDFPFLMREMGPLEAVIQAAGRCNREGKRAGAGGRVVVFRSEEGGLPLCPWYGLGREKVEAVIREKGDGPQIDDPAAIQDYYGRLFHGGSLDERKVQDLRRAFSFKQVAEAYKLIDDAGQPVVVRTWQPHAAELRGRGQGAAAVRLGAHPDHLPGTPAARPVAVDPAERRRPGGGGRLRLRRPADHPAGRAGAGGGDAVGRRGVLRARQGRLRPRRVRGAVVDGLAPARHAEPVGAGRGGRGPRPGGRAAAKGGRGLVRLSVPGVRTLLLRLVWASTRSADDVLAWSAWRRRHQCRARACHYRRRRARPPN